ncbi:GntR family transcriptional regulator [Aestuariivita boseongensis]|uniref:GntR family transcriptional regulator n=1 Tax=Aestuariivita boseongensis TaxID=1470562 RepID=UPI000680411B|nr:GntR family transcriptional regulator [Aestuariivita boseongensis]
MHEQATSDLPEGGKSRRVYLLLRDDIATGQQAEGSVLPSEQRLAEIHGVSRVTVRRALDALARDGLIEKKTGAGSIVRSARAPDGAITADMATLIPQIVQMGRDTSARLLSFSYGAPPALVRNALGLSDGARVQTATRVRSSDGTPFSHLTTYVPEEISRNYSEADLATTPLFELLERSGVIVASARQSVTATLAAPDVAEALGVSVGSALLALTRVVHDEQDRGIEYLSALYRPDMFRLDMSLTRVGGQDDRHWEPVIGGAP